MEQALLWEGTCHLSTKDYQRQGSTWLPRVRSNCDKISLLKVRRPRWTYQSLPFSFSQLYRASSHLELILIIPQRRKLMLTRSFVLFGIRHCSTNQTLQKMRYAQDSTLFQKVQGSVLLCHQLLWWFCKEICVVMMDWLLSNYSTFRICISKCRRGLGQYLDKIFK